MNEFILPSYFSIVIISAILSVIPFLVVAATSFAKISIVLFLVRNALGIQQTPPAVLLNTVALVLTLYIMAPVLREMYAVVTDPEDETTLGNIREIFDRAIDDPVALFIEHVEALYEVPPGEDAPQAKTLGSDEDTMQPIDYLLDRVDAYDGPVFIHTDSEACLSHLAEHGVDLIIEA